MFTGIVQGIAQLERIEEKQNLRSFNLKFDQQFAHGLQIGASVAVDGVCLTVAQLHQAQGVTVGAQFDVMQQTLQVTTLKNLAVNAQVNVERAAKIGDENGGHVVSGHVDCMARISGIDITPNNHRIRFEVPDHLMRYIFNKGFVALNGASLTVANADRQANWFEVWLIPETLRMTTFADKKTGDYVNLEIDRNTQTIVDTVELVLAQRLGPLAPA